MAEASTHIHLLLLMYRSSNALLPVIIRNLQFNDRWERHQLIFSYIYWCIVMHYYHTNKINLLQSAFLFSVGSLNISFDLKIYFIANNCKYIHKERMQIRQYRNGSCSSLQGKTQMILTGYKHVDLKLI